MSDPFNALMSLQRSIDIGMIQFQQCKLYTELKVYSDYPNGKIRFTYANISGNKVNAIALFVLTDPVCGETCFQVGYAVVETMRRKGLGTKVLRQAIEEFKHGFKKSPAKVFFLEAIVTTDNIASNIIAKRLISDSPASKKDCFTNQLSNQYLLKIDYGK